MSLNSLDSKISPHSLHSTNSESSSRLTICTRGCLQGCFASRLWEGAVDFGVISTAGFQSNKSGGHFRRNFRYFRATLRIGKPPNVKLSGICNKPKVELQIPDPFARLQIPTKIIVQP